MVKQLHLPDYLKIDQAAVRMRLKEDTLRKYARRGVIQRVKSGTTVLIPVEEVERFARERRKPGRPKAAAGGEIIS